MQQHTDIPELGSLEKTMSGRAFESGAAERGNRASVANIAGLMGSLFTRVQIWHSARRKKQSANNCSRLTVIQS